MIDIGSVQVVLGSSRTGERMLSINGEVRSRQQIDNVIRVLTACRDLYPALQEDDAAGRAALAEHAEREE